MSCSFRNFQEKRVRGSKFCFERGKLILKRVAWIVLDIWENLKLCVFNRFLALFSFLATLLSKQQLILPTLCQFAVCKYYFSQKKNWFGMNIYLQLYKFKLMPIDIVIKGGWERKGRSKKWWGRVYSKIWDVLRYGCMQNVFVNVLNSPVWLHSSILG